MSARTQLKYSYSVVNVISGRGHQIFSTHYVHVHFYYGSPEIRCTPLIITQFARLLFVKHAVVKLDSVVNVISGRGHEVCIQFYHCMFHEKQLRGVMGQQNSCKT